MKNVDTGEYFYSSTNENGEFGLQLADGQYKIELVVVDGALYTPIYLDKVFSVANGKLQVAGVEADLLDVTLPPSSLNVQLVKDGEPLKNIRSGNCTIKRGSCPLYPIKMLMRMESHHLE